MSSEPPVIPWSRITSIHLLVGILVCIAVPLVWDVAGAIRYLGIVIEFALLMGTGLAAPGVAMARIVWWLATRRVRDPVSEVMAVVLGALIGALVTWPVLIWVGGIMMTDFTGRILLMVLIGVGSSIGLSLWVLRAWYPRRVAAETGELPVN